VLADVITPEVQTERKVNCAIAPLLIDRWSPRSMTGEPLLDEELFPLFEAARWPHPPLIRNRGDSLSRDAKTSRSSKGFGVF
jgi:hypothetical protein